MKPSGRLGTPQQTDQWPEDGNRRISLKRRNIYQKVYPRKGLPATRQAFSFFWAEKKGPATITEPLYCTGVPETIRTSGPFLRREVLYPAELRGQKRSIFIYQVLLFGKEFSPPQRGVRP
jgi:hypothetical protein